METLSGFTQDLNHSRLSILKISIDGGEFLVIEQMLADPLRPEIDQILVRANYNNKQSTADIVRFHDVLERAGFEEVQSEYCAESRTPKCAYEYAFVRRGIGLLIGEEQ